MNPQDLWFNLPDTHSLCRAGGNGPNHPSQLYAVKKYVKAGESFLDYGCGSATTLEALLHYGASIPDFYVQYTGLDIIPKNIDWCRLKFKGFDFRVNPEIHKICEPDNSFDVVYSRHVVDHMRSFEDAMDEHCRVAKRLVVVVLWVPFSTSDEHQIKNIVDQGKTYSDEYTNSYSEKKVMEYLNNKNGWKILEITKDVGSDVKGHDTVIVLERG